jgi:hypothetical protein
LRNAVIAAAVAIVVLTAGALWFISDTTRDDRPRPRPEGHAEARPGPPPVEPGDQAGQGGAGGSAQPGTGTAAQPGASTGAVPAPRAAPAGPQPVPIVPWEQVRTAKLNAIRGPERDAVIFGMQNLKDDLNGCFQPHNQPKDGAQVPAAQGAWDEAGEGRTVLLLSLEARSGEVVVQDVAVQVRGEAADGLVSCYQRLLQGHSFTALNARPGWRQKVRLPVMPQK